MKNIRGLFPSSLSLSLIILLLWPASHVAARPILQAIDDQPKIDFPNTVSFHAELHDSSRITSVALEYGEQLETCGQVIAKAFPPFTPGT